MKHVIEERLEKLIEIFAKARCLLRPIPDNFAKTDDRAQSIWLSPSDYGWIVNIRISKGEILVFTIAEFMALVTDVAASIRSMEMKHASNSDKYSKRHYE
jgi:hypothetical protein